MARSDETGAPEPGSEEASHKDGEPADATRAAAEPPTEDTEPADVEPASADAEEPDSELETGERPPPESVGDIVQRTELMADRAIGKFMDKVELPDVRAEYGRAAAFLSSIHSGTLRLLLAVYGITTAAGVAVVLLGTPPIGTLPDWFMHAAMYVVIFSFLILYVKAHMMNRGFLRGIFALLTLSEMAFFAWVLFDLVPPRSLVTTAGSQPEVVLRPMMTELRIPAILLLVCAALLAIHWLVLSRYRQRESARTARAAEASGV